MGEAFPSIWFLQFFWGQVAGVVGKVEASYTKGQKGHVGSTWSPPNRTSKENLIRENFMRLTVLQSRGVAVLLQAPPAKMVLLTLWKKVISFKCVWDLVLSALIHMSFPYVWAEGWTAWKIKRLALWFSSFFTTTDPEQHLHYNKWDHHHLPYSLVRQEDATEHNCGDCL